MSSLIVFTVVLGVSFVLINKCFAQKLNEKCTLLDNTPGYCTHIKDCTKKYFARNITQNFCELDTNNNFVVCCPYDKIIRLRNSISTEKCLGYLKNTTKHKYERSIAGGFRALPGEFAHMAALGYQNHKNIEWKCGGTLISDQFVLTAAHCLRTKMGNVKLVRLGDLDLNTDDDMVTPQTFQAKKLIAHPEFQRKRKLNDIGLIMLNHTVKYGLHVFPACLHVNKKINYNTLVAIGWGSTQQYSEINNNNNKLRIKSLMKVNLNVFQTNNCRRFYHLNFGHKISSDSQFCAIGTEDGIDTCQGSSGSPLLKPTPYNKRLHYAVGLVSFGPQCGQKYKPGIYTKISYYTPWIESIVWP